MKVNIAVLTVTDTRTFENDKSGAILVKKIEEASHNLIDRKICRGKNRDINIFELDFLLTTHCLHLHNVLFSKLEFFF
mgnify:CR=1 FL=1